MKVSVDSYYSVLTTEELVNRLKDLQSKFRELVLLGFVDIETHSITKAIVEVAYALSRRSTPTTREELVLWLVQRLRDVTYTLEDAGTVYTVYLNIKDYAVLRNADVTKDPTQPLCLDSDGGLVIHGIPVFFSPDQFVSVGETDLVYSLQNDYSKKYTHRFTLYTT